MCVKLKEHRDHKVAELGTRIDRLRELRNIADYKPDKTVEKFEAQLNLASAVRVMEEADRLVKGKFPKDIDSY